MVCPLPYYSVVEYGYVPEWNWNAWKAWPPPKCLFCGEPLSRVPDPCAGTGLQLYFSVSTCTCGWWCASRQYMGTFFEGWMYAGLLRSFAPDTAEVPLSVLREEIRRSRIAANTVDPHRFQRLVQNILQRAWDCEVINLGTSRDGGIDLLALRGNEDVVAIQVKRRTATRGSERIEVVREFLGAAMLRGHKSLALITTASRFTRGGHAEAELAVQKRLVRDFKLIDHSALKEILSAVPEEPPWKVALLDQIKEKLYPKADVDLQNALKAIPALRSLFPGDSTS